MVTSDSSDEERGGGFTSQAHIAPAEGERRAVSGYYPQYRLSAILLLRALRRGELDWIRVADPEAGRVDDFQIGSPSRVDAYQVKWGQHPDSITFNGLISPSARAPSLIHQLADGWARLVQQHPGRRSVVHLATNDTPSVHDRLPHGEERPTPCHFSAFLAQAWRPVREAGDASRLPPEWRLAWGELREASCLSEAKFIDFVQDCDLEFGLDLDASVGSGGADTPPFQEQVSEVTELLFSSVASPQRLIEMSREELVSRLGWADRVTLRARHEFPVDVARYEAISATVAELQHVLSECDHGYISVIGDPGSGKSTLLTDVLRQRQERVFRYYSFVPEDATPHRGQAINFLHDLTHQIDRAGFRPGKSIDQYDFSQLTHRLHEQLQLLHDDWCETARKTIILVDGLDHVQRAPEVTQPLLTALPPVVPDGVLFVLGTQTTQLEGLAAEIIHQVTQQDRRIEMQRLTREQTRSIAGRECERLNLTAEQLDQIFALSAGHPLVLNYVLNYVQEISDPSGVGAALSQMPGFDGSMASYYFSLWNAIRNDDSLVRLLGHLARMREQIDLDWAEDWCTPEAIVRLRRVASHLFSRETSSRWYFFHDSFRQFLLKETAEACGGGARLHSELADHCADAPENSYWAWEELYHRFEADDHQAVNRLATQQRFRSQLIALRPPQVVEDEIRLALTAAGSERDAVAFLRTILAGSEISQRRYNLETVEVVDLLAAVLGPKVAALQLRVGNQLLVSPTTALGAIRWLASSDMHQEAKRVFELAEPLDLLSGRPIEDAGDVKARRELLKAWAQAATRMMPLDQVVTRIRGLRLAAPRWPQGDAETATRQMQADLLLDVGLELLTASGRVADFVSLVDELPPQDPHAALNRTCLHIRGWREMAETNPAVAGQLLNRLLDEITPAELQDDLRTLVAEGVYRVLQDDEVAVSILAGIPQPALYSGTDGIDCGMGPFWQRFRLNRLRTALGLRVAPEDAVPDTNDPEDRGLVMFERAVCMLASMWGRHWRGDALNEGFADEARRVLEVFHLHPSNGVRFHVWYAVHEACSEFCEALIALAHEVGPEALAALRGQFERLWSDRRADAYWPAGVRRDVAVQFGRHRSHRQWAAEQLTSIGERSLAEEGPQERIAEHEQQARAWLAIGRRGQARAEMQAMVEQSFGVLGRKDYQFSNWLAWLPSASQEAPEAIIARLEWLAGIVLGMSDFADGRAVSDASERLLQSAFDWRPSVGTSLFYTLVGAGTIHHDKAMLSLLRTACSDPEVDQQTTTHVLADFVLPISAESDAAIAADVVSRLATRVSAQTAAETADYLRHRADVYALPPDRAVWRQGLARGCAQAGIELSQAGLGTEDFRTTSHDENSPRVLRTSTDHTLSLDEVVTRCTTPQDLRELCEAEHEGSHFGWPRAIDQMAPQLGADQIHEVADVFEDGRHEAFVLSILSKRLFELGAGDDAWRLALRAFRVSSPRGWSHYDGGSRLAAAEAMVTVDPASAREAVFSVLVDDLLSEFWWPNEIAWNLSRLVPLLADQVGSLEVWTEIEDHIAALSQHVDVRPVALADSAPDLAENTASHALAQVVADHVDHPCSAVIEAAQRTCRQLLLKRNPAMHEATRRLLAESERKQQHVLPVLDAVSREKPAALTELEDEVVGLAESPNWAVRTTAGHICSRLGWGVPARDASSGHLPGIYGIKLPTAHNECLLLRPGEPMPDTRDPALMVQPFDHELSCVAEITGLPYENLCFRTAQFMRELQPEEEWSAQAERNLKDHLENAGLLLPLRRPRAVLARQAMLATVGEITAASTPPERAARALEEVLRYYDPRMLFVEPSARPHEVPPLSGQDDSHCFREDWPEEASDSRGLMLTEMKGYAVVAEHTTLRGLARPIPEETRRSCIHGLSGLELGCEDDHDDLCRPLFRCTLEEYEAVDFPGDPPPVIVRNRAIGFITAGSGWLALNPFVARSLGWSPAENELLAWTNEDGDLTVHTVWWRDGQPSTHGYSRDQVGEGWLVLASPEALAAINCVFGPLRRTAVVERTVNLDRDSLRSARWREDLS